MYASWSRRTCLSNFLIYLKPNINLLLTRRAWECEEARGEDVHISLPYRVIFGAHRKMCTSSFAAARIAVEVTARAVVKVVLLSGLTDMSDSTDTYHSARLQEVHASADMISFFCKYCQHVHREWCRWNTLDASSGLVDCEQA